MLPDDVLGVAIPAWELVPLAAAATAAAAVALALGLLIWLALPATRRRWHGARREPAFASHLPFERLDEDGVTVHCRNGWRMWAWRLEGLDHPGCGPEEQRRLYAYRAAGMTALAGVGVPLRWITVRRESEDEVEREGEARVPSVLREIDSKWRAHATHRLYRNEHYLVAYYERAKGKARGKDKQEGTAARAREDAARRARERIGEVLATAFEAYRPQALSADTWPQTPLRALQAVYEPVSSPEVSPAAGDPLQPWVGHDTAAFRRDGSIRFQYGERSKDAAVLGVRALPRRWMESTTLALQQVRGEIVIGHSLIPIPITRAVLQLTREARMAGEDMGSAEGTYTKTLESLQGSSESEEKTELVNYCLTVLCFGEDATEVAEVEKSVQRCLATAGAIGRREGWGVQAAYWHLLPGWPDPPRPWRMKSQWLAALVAPQEAPRGVRRHDWSPGPVTSLRSAQGTRFDFTFHPTGARSEAGHTVVVAATGSGKTHLTSHLAAQTLMIPEARVFLFDRNNGAEIFVRGAGGTYVGLSGDDQSSLNPFRMESSGENRRFLAEWMETLSGTDPGPAERQECERAVRVAMEYLPEPLRSLREVRDAALHPGRPLSEGLRMWCEGPYADVFNADEDRFAQWNERLIGFDCTTAFDEPRLAPGLIGYLMHRIREHSRVRSDPTLVYIDECEPMLRQPKFVELFRQGLLEGRKLRQVYICCFQRLGPLQELGVADLVLNQCQTAILLRNPRADPEEYARFGLSDAEKEFVFGAARVDLRHAALIKRREGESAIVETDLRPLGDHRMLYESDRRDVLRFRALVAEQGVERGTQAYLEGRSATA